MEIQLILSDVCPHCAEAERIWRDLCEKNSYTIHVMKQGQTEADQLINDKNIKTFPVLIISGEIKAVGHPTIDTAQRFFSEHISV